MILLNKMILLAATAAVLYSCGGDDSSSNPISDAVSAIGNASAVNELAAAYPYALSASAFPTTVSSASLALLGEDQEKTTKEKIEDTDKILRADVENCFTPGKYEDAARPNVTCYEFDNDMNPFDNGNNQTGGTKDGKHTNGEACLVAFTRQQVGDAIEKLERGLGLVSTMICQVKKAGGDASLPAVDEENDYTDALESAAGGKTPISSATLTRMADEDGRAVYRTDISFRNPKGIDTELSLIHSPGATSDEDEGSLFISSALLAPDQTAGDMNNNEENMNRALSIKYAGSIVDGEPRMRMQISRANILNTIEPFDSNGSLNYADIPENADNMTSNGNDLTEFDINPKTNEGLFAYWRNPGGNYNEAARGLLFSVEKDENGGLKGCGVSGAVNGVSIRKSLLDPVEANELKPETYWHPRGLTNHTADSDPRFATNDGQNGPFFTKQCFAQDTASGLYLIDETSLNNAEDKDSTQAIARGYSVLPGANLDIGRPTPPRDKGFAPPPKN